MSSESKPLAEFVVPGPPHSQKVWVTRVIDAAIGQPNVSEPCELDIEFVRETSRTPWILPSEVRLSTMLPALLAALEETVLRAPGDTTGVLVSVKARVLSETTRRRPATRIVIRRAKPRG